jgi:HSP20 family protein
VKISRYRTEVFEMARERESKREKKEAKDANAKRKQESLAAEGSGNRESRTDIARREAYTPSVWSGSPFSFMRRFSEEMDRLFGDFGFGRDWLGAPLGRALGRGALEQSIWSPQVELFEREGKLIVLADLPGMTKDNVDVEITNDSIVVHGERQQEREENEEGYYRTERSYGSFYRSIPLPDGVNADEAKATFNNGVLEITMPAPARAEQRGRRLEVRDASTTEEETKSRAKAAGR